MKIVKIPKREEGQGLIEYALILVLVAIVVIIILTQIGSLIVLAFATIIGSFTEQPLTNTGAEGIVVSNNDGTEIGGNQCQLQSADISVVLVDDGGILTNESKSVNFDFGGTTISSNVTIGSSGVGSATLPGLPIATCPARLKVISW